VLAACKTCTPLPWRSIRLFDVAARLSRPCSCKKLVGLVEAVLTFLPLADTGPGWSTELRGSIAGDIRFWRT